MAAGEKSAEKRARQSQSQEDAGAAAPLAKAAKVQQALDGSSVASGSSVCGAVAGSGAKRQAPTTRSSSSSEKKKAAAAKAAAAAESRS
eukprot:11460796-Alexandrium_andersonii.AAC.2